MIMSPKKDIEKIVELTNQSNSEEEIDSTE